MKYLLLFLTVFILTKKLFAYSLNTEFLNYQFKQKTLLLRVGIVPSQKHKTLADIIYVHGFADRLDNHKPLFDQLSKSGFRVISFDLPSHGENQGPGNNLNDFNFQQLSQLLSFVENQTAEHDVNRPLFLAGWSTGGLIVV